MERLLWGAFVLMTVAGPLGWRMWRDRVAARGLALRATVEASVRDTLNGESLVAVDVRASVWWRRGVIVLRAPTGCRCLIAAVSALLQQGVPADYDLMVPGTGRLSPRRRHANRPARSHHEEVRA